jgi:lipopolysaccharide export system protein LptA
MQFISHCSGKGIFILHVKNQPMKHYFLFVLLSLIVSTTFAQKLESGDYAIKIKIEKRSEDNMSNRTEGSYTIKKGSTKLSADFTTLELKKTKTSIKNFINLKIMDKDGSGNTLTYNTDTKKYEWNEELYTVADTSTIESIILAGLLIYAKTRI